MLSRSSEYALRIMAYLALNSESGPIRAKDLASAANIPGAYVSKIMRRMVTAGLLSATRGHGGGFVLAKNPCDINFATILDVMNGDDETRLCVFGLEVCSDRTPCVLHECWRKARSAFDEWADSTTLAHVRSDLRTGKRLPAGFVTPKRRTSRV